MDIRLFRKHLEKHLEITFKAFRNGEKFNVLTYKCKNNDWLDYPAIMHYAETARYKHDARIILLPKYEKVTLTRVAIHLHRVSIQADADYRNAVGIGHMCRDGKFKMYAYAFNQGPNDADEIMAEYIRLYNVPWYKRANWIMITQPDAVGLDRIGTFMPNRILYMKHHDDAYNTEEYYEVVKNIRKSDIIYANLQSFGG